MSEQVDYIKTFMQQNINEKLFNKNKVCEDKKYKEIIKHSVNIINNLNEEELDFHMMLCKFIKDKKILLVDEDNFNEYNVESFVYNDNKLNLISLLN